MKLFRSVHLYWLAGIHLAASPCTVAANDFAVLCTERAAIERVYHRHRTGQTRTFEEALPPPTLEGIVRREVEKEATLERVYGGVITRSLLDAEVQRINTTTRAPEMLAEIKAALGNDPARFASAFAKPLLVQRLLRDKFENDDVLHAPQRGNCEQIRNTLLLARTNGASTSQLLVQLRTNPHAVTEVRWEFTARPPEPGSLTAEELEIKRLFGPQAQFLSSPPDEGKDRKFYFEELPGDLQRVLRVQLRQPGDVSAVIELPAGFHLYLCTARTPEALNVAALNIPKRNFEQWLEAQKETQP